MSGYCSIGSPRIEIRPHEYDDDGQRDGENRARNEEFLHRTTVFRDACPPAPQRRPVQSSAQSGFRESPLRRRAVSAGPPYHDPFALGRVPRPRTTSRRRCRPAPRGGSAAVLSGRHDPHRRDALRLAHGSAGARSTRGRTGPTLAATRANCPGFSDSVGVGEHHHHARAFPCWSTSVLARVVVDSSVAGIASRRPASRRMSDSSPSLS